MAMTRIMQILLVAGILLGLGGTSAATPPAYEGPLGNPEEPALRPYKALWQGAKALVHRSSHCFVEGNLKTPVVGSVEVLRGVRQGAVDCLEYSYRGMQGSVPPRGDEYKQPGKANTVIEDDMLLRNASDLAVGIGVMRIGSQAGCAADALGAYAVQKGVDRWPVQGDVERQAQRKQAKLVRESRKAAAQKRQPAESRVEKARRAYLGRRYPVNRKANAAGSFLKLGR